MPEYKAVPRVESCALWEYKSKSGEKYLRGALIAGGQEYSIMLFKNKFKEECDARPVYQYNKKKEW